MGGQTAAPVTSSSQRPANSTPPLLLPEILGFSPQLLLDDIINIANNAVQDGVNGMEEFLQKWADERAAREGGDWDSTQEVEQGLVAFQTLLEYHTDIAFDFFEAWSLRNIFAIPSGVLEGRLPVVVPHQEGLDLTCTPEREQGLIDECHELRQKIDNVRDSPSYLICTYCSMST
jgi:kinetochore protein Mis12/MTW1